MLIPCTNLSALFPQQAAAFVESRGGSVTCGQAVAAISVSTPGRWNVTFKQDTDTQSFDGVIIATAPEAAADLLDGLCDTTTLRAFSYEPITTCYLQYPAAVRLEQPFFALTDDAELAAWGQFVFDRGQLNGVAADAGLLAVVISAAGDAIAEGHSALAAGVAAQLAQQLGDPQLDTPLWSKVISEKRATFSCTPGLLRPDNTGMPAGLGLAGDYVAGDYPATLEAAVRSGVAAAALFA
jgi:predicted NAD/FAD-dependent oxidoreductase